MLQYRSTLQANVKRASRMQPFAQLHRSAVRVCLTVVAIIETPESSEPGSRFGARDAESYCFSLTVSVPE